MNKKSIYHLLVELYDLAITEQPDDRFGRVHKKGKLTIDQLVELAVSGRTDLNPNTLKSSFEILRNIAIDQIASGASVNFGLGYFNLNVNGVFYGDNAKWDSSKHSLSVHVTPTAELREAVNNCKVEVRGKAPATIAVNTVTNVATGEVNKTITPGAPLNVVGSRIRIEGDQAGVGIKLVNETTGEEFEIPFTHVSDNSPSSLSFVAPANLVTGDYRLVLSTQYSSSGTLLKEVRTYSFEYVLTVN